ncbi:MAG TPA: hypothetical protein VJT73_09620, partial [Polyangiaceae bacterium]|nr:hypothetical protein [Polyangiaceae bacterium]
WRMLSADPPITVGWADNTIATAARPGDPPAAIWPLEGDGVPDTIRAVDANEAGIAVVFRRKGEIFAGMVGRDRTPRGGLVKIAGAGAPAGSPVGAPAIALSGSTIAVAFADRASPQDPWAVRIGTAPLGSFPKDTSGFVLPPGGPGGAAIAPALAGISDGRWLLVWTEGSGGEHVVRAQTVDDAFKPVGAPFALSHEGGNAGQGAVALRNGQGLAAYLALTDHGYELWGAPIDCR